VIANHPAINNIVSYDKKGKGKGLAAAWLLVRRLRQASYDAAIIPHRSLRSATICYFTDIPRRIGFSTSAGRFLLTDVVNYEKESHEIVRNLNLLRPLGIAAQSNELPRLYPSRDDSCAVDELLCKYSSINRENMIAVAPGSVWATKRWLPERYVGLCTKLADEGFSIVLIGGEEDLRLGNVIESSVKSGSAVNAMGKLTVLQSAELIGRCRLAISNDSSPMHLAVAMRTPVVAIFGATVPEFGFAPLGEHNEVVQTLGLKCRPCAIHGGNNCPIKTFDCMKNIQVEIVLEKVHAILFKLNAVLDPERSEGSSLVSSQSV
jgi:heptosyltransferase-2